ncbi:MAG: hypothetical protein SOX57_06775 [Schaalia hyovaginalis]|uniref:hypothetical protein n=2 Tax=Schaalia hyovaginalis TaxID=29316 RepID=UPI0012B235FC|nr:hypothetical protein [Schaalia hyovaginalis]MDY4263017.1 hypothetical protein [Schaalia hyovaginalis]MDY5601515.1 hypothetical protein [Schaalia hyovaginalis]MDY6213669.1 hypothetical protein [Schaalia hyovaginalis]MST64183.1 hypothetical protein [Schaalia hyovaginalis]
MLSTIYGPGDWTITVYCDSPAHQGTNTLAHLVRSLETDSDPADRPPWIHPGELPGESWRTWGFHVEDLAGEFTGADSALIGPDGAVVTPSTRNIQDGVFEYVYERFEIECPQCRGTRVEIKIDQGAGSADDTAKVLDALAAHQIESIGLSTLARALSRYGGL